MINIIKKIYNNKTINLFPLKLILFFLFSITSVYFYLNIIENINPSKYAFNELFINYQAGFIRRGLLGEIFWHLNNFLEVKRVLKQDGHYIIGHGNMFTFNDLICF